MDKEFTLQSIVHVELMVLMFRNQGKAAGGRGLCVQSTRVS